MHLYTCRGLARDDLSGKVLANYVCSNTKSVVVAGDTLLILPQVTFVLQPELVPVLLSLCHPGHNPEGVDNLLVYQLSTFRIQASRESSRKYTWDISNLRQVAEAHELFPMAYSVNFVDRFEVPFHFEVLAVLQTCRFRYWLYLKQVLVSRPRLLLLHGLYLLIYLLNQQILNTGTQYHRMP